MSKVIVTGAGAALGGYAAAVARQLAPRGLEQHRPVPAVRSEVPNPGMMSTGPLAGVNVDQTELPALPYQLLR